jgi:hypothetical protein
MRGPEPDAVRRGLTVGLALAFVLHGCGTDDAPTPEPGDPASPEAAPQAAFWSHLSRPCGQAFAGRLVQDRPDRDLLSFGDPIIAHWALCEDRRLHIAVHISRDGGASWDRSRTWVLTRDEAGIELRHDHRLPDGSATEDTWYGGRTVDRGTADTQWFLFTERRAADGSVLGWRLEIEPDRRYTYGTIRGDSYTWRVDFDLSEPVEIPPPAWGHNGQGATGA